MIVCGFDFPEGLHYLAAHQTWARVGEGGIATVGITALGIHLAGEIYMCRPKAAGSEVEQGHSIAVVELAKSIVSVKSPVSGRVVAVNPRLEDTPELVHQDPFGEGWLVRLQLTRFIDDLPALAHGSAVHTAMSHHAWLHGLAEGKEEGNGP